MSSSRRVVLGSAIGSAVGAAALGAATLLPTSRRDSGALARRNLILEENKNPGSERWRIGQDQSKPAYDFDMKIKGFASATSVEVGGSIDFFVTVSGGDDFTIAIYRMGHYGGAGGRLLTISPNLPGHRQADPIMDEDSVSCAWQRSWTLRIPTSWVSGVFLAVFTTGSGWRSYTPFVVRDLRRMADLCVILPFSTYQAYNLWPHDGQRGKSLYYGYDLPVDKHDRLTLHYGKRANKVSFDRPYGNYGLPNGFDLDAHFIEWAESRGYDAVYSSTLDLHLGLLELSRYKGVVFSGHDEYWSAEMRAAAANAVAKGTSLAFMTANNVYWHVRFESKPGGNSNRVMVCYKEAQDPNARTNRGTGRWRDPQPSPANPEQDLLGVMYNGILNAPVPLVVKNSEHWFWAGTGVKDGDRIANVVGGEVDGYADDAPAPVGVKQTLLSASPYFYAGKNRTMIQNTSLYETRSGAIVFAAGSLTWPKSLGAPVLADPRIQTATANMLDRMVANHQ